MQHRLQRLGAPGDDLFTVKGPRRTVNDRVARKAWEKAWRAVRCVGPACRAAPGRFPVAEVVTLRDGALTRTLTSSAPEIDPGATGPATARGFCSSRQAAPTPTRPGIWFDSKGETDSLSIEEAMARRDPPRSLQTPGRER